MRRAERPARGENCSCARTFARSLGGGGVKPSTKALLLGLAVLLALAAAWAVSIAQAQNQEQTGRIVAQRLADGRTEFGWQPAGGERILPRARYFPADAQVDRWLNSSPVEVEGVAIGRINARMLDDGRIEFAFTPTDGERIEPSARYFPANARANRWLRSTEITISAAPAAGFVAISAGDWHACAIRAESGEIACWGDNYAGQLDAPIGSFSAISAGDDYTCAIRAGSGAIECWGSRNNRWGVKTDYGQLDAPPGSFTAVAAGQVYACAIRAGGGEIACWGSNSRPELVAANEDGEEVWEEAHVGRLDAPTGRFTAVYLHYYYACGLRESGAIECWGIEIYPAPPDAPPDDPYIPVSGDLACLVRESGAIGCWGGLGGGGATDAPAGSFTAVAGGYRHTCAIRAGSGEIACWGSNSRPGEAQYNKDTGEWTQPEEIYAGQLDAPPGRFIAVAAAVYYSCAIRDTGAIECWGWNEYGATDPPAP